jgi:hypothetical protein
VIWFVLWRQNDWGYDLLGPTWSDFFMISESAMSWIWNNISREWGPVTWHQVKVVLHVLFYKALHYINWFSSTAIRSLWPLQDMKCVSWLAQHVLLNTLVALHVLGYGISILCSQIILQSCSHCIGVFRLNFDQINIFK